MSTKPNQPKAPKVWIENGDKLLKLVEVGYESGNVSEGKLKKLKQLLKKLKALSKETKISLSKVTVKTLKRLEDQGQLPSGESIIHQLNELRFGPIGNYWKKFGSQVSGSKYTHNFYPLKLNIEQRKSLETACLFYLNQYEKHICNAYRYEHEQELQVEEIKKWLVSDDLTSRGREKHKFDSQLAYILQYAMENEIAAKEMSVERRIKRENKK
ncbi:MAG: hypothetical protein ACI87J_002547 [Colwellia sp.]|jgi:hypothetical protein